jgi:hypothetical protein
MNEIEAIRDFYGECAEAPSERIRREFERRASAAPPPRLGRRVPLAIALAAALAGALALLPGSRHSHVGPLATKNASAATVLRRAAARIAGLPDLEPGQFLYSSGTRTVISSAAPAQGKRYSYVREHEELWVSLDGTVRDRWTSDGSQPATNETSNSPRAFEQSFGMTLGEMRALPSDPARLRVRLHEIDERWKAATPATDPTREDPFRVAISVLVGPSRPAVKAALLDALAELPGVRRLADERLHGERVFAIAARFRSNVSKRPLIFDHVLLLDPATGELRGARYVSVGSFDNLPPGTTTSRWEWRQAIVARVGARPSTVRGAGR